MTPRALLFCAAAIALAAGCAPRFDPRLVDAPISAGRRWISTENVQHPLVGRIWSPRAQGFVDEAALDAQLASADFVALGETHDNPDHHLLQARLLRTILAAGRRPPLGFEMITSNLQPEVDASLARAPRNPDALAAAVGWAKSGWPPFELYRPIVAAGLAAGTPVVAANLPNDKAKEVVKKGRDVLDPALRSRLERDEPLPEDVLEQFRAEMSESHCGELPAAMFDGLVLAQRARDASMAERLLAAGRDRGGVLISGSGHARTDRAVPAILRKDVPARKVLGIAFLEVRKDVTDPAGYAKDWGKGPLPFDFVVFTPGLEREDPCEAMRAHMKKMKADRPAEKPAAPAPKRDPAAPPAGAPRRPVE